MNLPKLKLIRQVNLVEVRCKTYATLCIFGAAVALAIAFVTPSWLESETMPNQRFRKLGLWVACFAKLHDHHYRYDRVISGCKFIFDEDYAFMLNYLEPRVLTRQIEAPKPTANTMPRGSSSQDKVGGHRSQQHALQPLPPAIRSQTPTTAVKSTRQSAREIEQQRRASLRARFGKDASELRLAVFVILIIALVLTGLAFFSTNWLEVESRYYGSKFKKLGLWRMCFNSYSAPDDFQFKKFYVGCRWIFADEYKPIRKFLLPAFFLATQVLYSAGFLLLVLVCAGILAVQQCFIIEREDYVFRALSVASVLSASACTSAVTLFAIYATREDWMPDPEHNFLSWSFAAALIGSVLLWVAALMFYIEMRLIVRRNSRQRGHTQTR